MFFFFSSRRRHTRFSRDWSSDVCSSDLYRIQVGPCPQACGLVRFLPTPRGIGIHQRRPVDIGLFVALHDPTQDEGGVLRPLKPALVPTVSPENRDTYPPPLLSPHHSGHFQERGDRHWLRLPHCDEFRILP